MLLNQAIDIYVRAVDGSAGYRNQLRWCVAALERFARRALAVPDVTGDFLGKYLAWAKEAKLSPVTRRSRRNMLLRLCRHFGHEIANPPRVKVPPPVPHAWSVEQVRTLLETARSSRHHHRYWNAYVLTAWDTGLRRCDLFQLRAADLGLRSVVRQKKTGKPIAIHLRSAALEALRQLPGECPLAPWCQLSVWSRCAQRLVRRAQLPGSIGWLRHSAATAVELEHPGKGYLFTGNTPEVFYRHYFDRSKGEILQPDEL